MLGFCRLRGLLRHADTFADLGQLHVLGLAGGLHVGDFAFQRFNLAGGFVELSFQVINGLSRIGKFALGQGLGDCGHFFSNLCQKFWPGRALPVGDVTIWIGDKPSTWSALTCHQPERGSKLNSGAAFRASPSQPARAMPIKRLRLVDNRGQRSNRERGRKRQSLKSPAFPLAAALMASPWAS
jgi:hypothetical protein